MNEPVFQDTLRLSRSLPLIPTLRYRGLLQDYVFEQKNNDGAKIEFKNVDCVHECIHLLTQYPGRRIGLLNMASDIRPGGGVLRGAQAQEEDICRRTNLYATISKQTYPLRDDDILFSPDVKILKNSNYQAFSEPITIHGVLSAAALRRPQKKENGMFYLNESDKEVMRMKIQLLLQTAAFHNIDCLVLGAWGCGAFCNPVNEVAKLFAEELKKADVRKAFLHVTFAIRDNPGRSLCNEFRDAFTRVLAVQKIT